MVSASGVATTEGIAWSYNAAVGKPGVLTVNAWVTANKVNFAYCNPTAAGVTPTDPNRKNDHEKAWHIGVACVFLSTS